MCLQSTMFRYAWMVFLAGAGIRFIWGTWAWWVWDPSPVIHRVGCSGVTEAPGNRVTVLCPASHRRAPYFFHVVSPSHSSSHCPSGRSDHGGPCSRADFPMSFSRRLRSILRCLVAVAKEIPRPGFGSSFLQVLNSSKWSHMDVRCHTLSSVSSHDLAPASWISSSLEVHSHSFMTLSKSFLIIFCVTSSVFMQRSV